MKQPSEAAPGGNTITAEEQENTETMQELQSLGRKVRDWQMRQQPSLSDIKLLNRFPALGSTKTYQRILTGDLRELNLDKQLAAYRATWEIIQEEQPVAVEDIVIDSMDTIVKPRLACLEARSASDNTRFVLIEGDTGCGKTTALNAICSKYRGIRIEASAAWKDRPSALLFDLAVALGGGKDATLSQPARLREVIALLSNKAAIICIDEGHEMGPKCLNTLRTLINQSKAVWIVAALHTLWERLEKKDAYAEARQLVGNRLQRRVKLHRVSSTDARKLIQAITGIAGDPTEKDGILAQAAAMVLMKSERNGHMKFVKRVATTAKDLAEDEPVELKHIANAIAAELEKR